MTNSQQVATDTLAGVFGGALMSVLFIVAAFYCWRLAEEALEARLARRLVRDVLEAERVAE